MLPQLYPQRNQKYPLWGYNGRVEKRVGAEGVLLPVSPPLSSSLTHPTVVLGTPSATQQSTVFCHNLRPQASDTLFSASCSRRHGLGWSGTRRSASKPTRWAQTWSGMGRAGPSRLNHPARSPLHPTLDSPLLHTQPPQPLPTPHQHQVALPHPQPLPPQQHPHPLHRLSLRLHSPDGFQPPPPPLQRHPLSVSPPLGRPTTHPATHPHRPSRPSSRPSARPACARSAVDSQRES